jgi:hypothetical protein
VVCVLRDPAALVAACSTLLSWSTMSDSIASPAVRAPDFPDTLDWVHTGGRRLTLGDFRGKLLLLDFWTYG